MSSRNELLADLIEVQNHPLNWNRDIVSMSALLSDEEMFRHVRSEAARLSRRFSVAGEPTWLEFIRLRLQMAARGLSLPLAA